MPSPSWPRPRICASPCGSPARCLNTEGLAGLADGLAVLRGVVETFWDGFYPKLDPEDDNDPTFRVNILMGLCDSARLHRPHSPDPAGQRHVLRTVQPARHRHRLRRDSAACRRRSAQDVGHRRRLHRVPGARRCRRRRSSLRASLDRLAAIEAFVGEKVGASSGTNFAKLTDTLRAAEKILVARLARRGVVRRRSAGAERRRRRIGWPGAAAGRHVHQRRDQQPRGRAARARQDLHATTSAPSLRAPFPCSSSAASAWFRRVLWTSFGTSRPTALHRSKTCAGKTKTRRKAVKVLKHQR